MNNISRHKNLIVILLVAMLITLVGGSTLALLSWINDEDDKTNVVFTVNSEYSCSANVDNSITSEGIRLIPTRVNSDTTSNYIKKKIDLKPLISTAGKIIYMDLWLEVKSLGEGLANSDYLMYAITSSSESIEGALATGNFKDKIVGDKLLLLSNQEYSESITDTYYLWIWLDSEETSYSVMGEGFEFVIGGLCDEDNSQEVETQELEITSTSSKYQMVKAKAVTSKNEKIVSYAVTKEEEEPSIWFNVTGSSNQYEIEYFVDSIGKYKIWFKDSLEKIVSRIITINNIDEEAPSCTFGSYSTDTIYKGSNVTVDITCTDSGVGMDSNDIKVSDITSSNSQVVISGMTSQKITNGYKYTVSLSGDNITSNGSAILSLNSIVKDKANNSGNIAISSGTLTVSNQDKKKPTITFSPDGSSNYSVISTINVTVSDDSGISAGQTIYYRFQQEAVCSTNKDDYSNSLALENTILPSKSESVTIYTLNGILGIGNLHGEYYLCIYGGIKDIYSNTTDNIRSNGVYLFDMVAPTMSISVNDPKVFTRSKEATITLEDSGPSYLKGGTYKVKYAWSLNTLTCNDISEENTVTMTVNTGDKSVSTKIEVDGYDGMGKIYACPVTSISDNAGNSLANTKIVQEDMYLDNGAPVIEITPSNGDNYAMSQVVKISIKDLGYGIKGGNYTLRYGISQDSKSCSDLTDTLVYSVNDGDKEVSKEITLSDMTGEYYVYVCNDSSISDTEDNVMSGNKLFSKKIYLDNEKPTMSIILDEGEVYKKSHSATIKIKDTGGAGFKSNQTLKYGFSTGSLSCNDMTNTVTTSGSGDEITANITINSGNGIGKLYVCGDSVRDSAGNTLQDNLISTGMYMDTGTPGITLTVNDGTTVMGRNTGIVTISDELSGLAMGEYKIEYEWSTKTTVGLRPKCGSMANSTTINITSDGEKSGTVEIPIYGYSGNGYLYVCNPSTIIDMAGNRLESTTLDEKMYLKNTEAPSFSISVSDPLVYAKSKDAVVTLKVGGDTYLKGGTYNFKYGFSENEVSCDDLVDTTSVKVSTVGNHSTASFSVSISDKTGAGKIYVCNTDEILDKDSNVLAAKTMVSTEMYLDNEAPTGSVIVNASSTKITAVVSAIDNHSGIAKYGYYLQKDNSSCPTSGYIVSTNANYSFLDSYTSGEYYVCVQLIDALGNTSIVMGHTTLTTREIPVRGAIGEVITISDSDNNTVGSITLDGSGNGITSLDNGSYIFTSNIAKDTSSGSSNYSKNIVIDNNTNEIENYPEGAIYWYGNGDEEGESLYTKYGGVKTGTHYKSGSSVYAAYDENISYETDHFRMIGQATSAMVYRVNGRSYYFANSINKNGYGNINTRYSLDIGITTYTYTSTIDLISSISDNYTALGSYAINKDQGTLLNSQISLSGVSDSFYYNIHLLGKGSTVNFKQTLDMYAIWMSE